MKVKSLLKIVLGSLILASCAPEMEEIPAEELYLRDFIKKYGIIDPNQNWSLASNEVVSVRGAGGAEAKIYVEIKGKRYIVADYKNIADPAALTFDIPSGMEDVIVKVNGKEFPTKVGSTVDASAARSRTITESGTNGKITWEPTEVAYLHTTAVSDFISTYPEGGNNLLNGTNSFYFEADGNYHTFYPFYWNTNAYHCLGIYYLNNDGSITMQDLYYSKSGELEYSYNYVEGGITKTKYIRCYYSGGASDGEACQGLHKDEGYIVHIVKESEEVKDEWGNSYSVGDCYHSYEYVTETSGDWSKANQQAYMQGENTTIRTRGIKYKLNKGTLYGFYIKVGHYGTNLVENPFYDYVVFSHSERNRTYVDPNKHTDSKWDTTKDVNYLIRESPWTDTSWWTEQGLDDKDAYAYSSWGTAKMEGKTYTLFGFEDCGHGFYQDACDLNDIMFLFAAGEQPSNVKIEEPEEPDEPLPWTLAVEDLGESDDYDFNDLVLEITHVAGTNKATVKALAAGGIMPIYVKYGDELIAETHVNQWLGSDDHTVMINTGAGATGTHSTPIPITVGENEDIEAIIAKFTIVVKTGEGEKEETAVEITKTNYGEVGTTPLMLLLDHDWEWPQERVSIEAAYPKFTEWVGTPEVDWISSKVEENVIKKQ